MTDEEKIRRFVLKRAGKDKRRKPAAITSKTRLFGANLLDSFGVLELVAFVEESFGVPLKREEIRASNFDTIEKILKFVSARRKKAVSA